MIIADVIPIMKAELALRRTPSGWPITEYALENIEAAIQDEKNWESEAVKCPNCCIIQSSLLVPEGCPNCGSKDKSTEIIIENIK